MSSHAPLRTLLGHEEKLRDDAQARLQQALQRQRQVQTQAEQLGGYRSEVRQRWGAQFATQGAGIQLLHCYQGFDDRLAQALDQQQQMQAQAAALVERLRAALLAQELRVASVRKLIERREADALRLETRRDQKRNDEAAARSIHASAWRRPVSV